jgi:hypothetical protein
LGRRYLPNAFLGHLCLTFCMNEDFGAKEEEGVEHGL